MLLHFKKMNEETSPIQLGKVEKNKSHPTWKSGKVSDKLYKTSAEAPVAGAADETGGGDQRNFKLAMKYG